MLYLYTCCYQSPVCIQDDSYSAVPVASRDRIRRIGYDDRRSYRSLLRHYRHGNHQRHYRPHGNGNNVRDSRTRRNLGGGCKSQQLKAHLYFKIVFFCVGLVVYKTYFHTNQKVKFSFKYFVKSPPQPCSSDSSSQSKPPSQRHLAGMHEWSSWQRKSSDEHVGTSSAQTIIV